MHLITCDRCNKILEVSKTSYGTCGYYDLSANGPWVKYAKEYELKICDDCMQSNELFKEDYGTYWGE